MTECALFPAPVPLDTPQYFVGVEGGGSKTIFVLGRLHKGQPLGTLEIVARSSSGTTNPNGAPPECCREFLAEGFNSLFQSFPLQASQGPSSFQSDLYCCLV